MDHKTVVVIATYNEAETIAEILAALANYQVVVIDDNSPDGTAEIADRFPHSIVIVRREVRGIASAYLQGFRYALEMDCERIVQMDAGGTHDPAVIPAMLSYSHPDLLIGSRFVGGAPPIESVRTLISLGAAELMRYKGVPVSDATSGFRVWRAETLRDAMQCGVTAQGFAFQLELLWNAYKTGAIIGEYPIDYRLTNSSFRPAMLVEALRVYRRLR